MAHRFRPHSILLLLLLLGLAPGAFPAPAGATTLNWIQAGNGSASTAANWSPAQVPAAGDGLVFNLAGTRVISWDAAVGSSASHTWRTGSSTLLFNSPHFVSGTRQFGTVGGDAPFVVQSQGIYVSGGSANLGVVAGTNAQLRVSGGTAVFQVQNAGADIVAGVQGAGRLDALNGAIVQIADDLILGSAGGAIGTVLVSGTGPSNASTLATYDVNGDIIVGNSGTGTLTVASGGNVNAADDLLVAGGTSAGGTVTVGGAGSLLAVKDECLVSNNALAGVAPGTATVNVDAGGTLTVGTDLRVGDPDGGTGTLHLNGGLVHTRGFALDPTHGVLDFDGGTLRVDGGIGSHPGTGNLVMGATAGQAVLEVVRGADMSVSGSLYLPGSGGGQLVVDSGASLFVNGAVYLTIGTNDVVVDSSATLTVDGRLNLGGSSAVASLLVDHGGVVDLVSFEAADEGGGVASIALHGGSRMQFNSQCFLGGDEAGLGGVATMTVGNGARLAQTGAGATITIFPSSRLAIDTGGSVSTTGELKIEGLLQLDGGVDSVSLNTLLGNGQIAGHGSATGRVVSAVATSRIRVGGSLALGNAGSTTGFDVRGTIEVGDGVLTLRDANGITLGDSTLIDGGGIVSAVALTVPAAGFLGAFGGIQAPTVSNLGTVAVRHPLPATLGITGAYTQGSGGTLRLRIHGTDPGETDRLQISGAASLAGTLHLVFDPDAAYAGSVYIPLLTYASRTGPLPALIVEGMDPAAFGVFFTATSLGIQFFAPVAVDPGAGMPAALAFVGRSALGGGAARFELALPDESFVRVAAFDARGRRVAVLAEGPLPAGVHRLPVPAGIAPGVYFGRATIRPLVGGPAVRRSARVVVP